MNLLSGSIRGGPTVEINGETMTREEMERRYPDRITIDRDIGKEGE